VLQRAVLQWADRCSRCGRVSRHAGDLEGGVLASAVDNMLGVCVCVCVCVCIWRVGGERTGE
jgi:hypothetical protein